MTRKFALYIICLLFLVSMVFSAFASAEIVVGVKAGDWIEYNVTITGEVPKQHDVTWCRFDVTAVDGKNKHVANPNLWARPNSLHCPNSVTDSCCLSISDISDTQTEEIVSSLS